MADTLRALFERARTWCAAGQAAGWLGAGDDRRVAEVEQRTPADLFEQHEGRPLVVVFFGGTGVGKSSLLNRLAGAAIARVGVERPTSRDVTLYLHEEVDLAQFPAELPLEHVRVVRHAAAAGREVVWIDAPDIDSTEERNRACALAWLPHVDLVCYVVSPERYRDDAGWRVLRARGQKHGWMFVFNHWDEGDAGQRDDFLRMLRGAGFEEPLLLCSSCTGGAPPLPSPDEFERIRAVLHDLLAAHGVRELTRLGHRARLLELRAALRPALERFGSEAQWDELGAALHEQWGRTSGALREGIEWTLRTTAIRLAGRDAGVLRPVVDQLRRVGGAGVRAAVGLPPGPAGGAAPAAVPAPVNNELVPAGVWDDWTQSKVDAFVGAFEVALARTPIAAQPVLRRLEDVAGEAESAVVGPLNDHLRAALARPGTALQRALRRATGFLTAVLPTIALLVVAWNVVTGYLRGTLGSSPFLGVEFAVQSVLFVLIAWLVPWWLDRLLRPSLERAALAGLRRGFAEGLAVFEKLAAEGLVGVRVEADGHQQAGLELIRDIERALRGGLEEPAPVVRQLIARTEAA